MTDGQAAAQAAGTCQAAACDAVQSLMLAISYQCKHFVYKS